MKSLLRHADGWLRRQSKARFAIAGCVLVVGLGYLDYATGPDISPVVFYLIPILLIAWYAGRGPGALMAVASALVSLLADALTGEHYPHPAIPYWNGVARLAAFFVVSYTVSALRASIDREKELARTDPLTGVGNVRAFHEGATAELARARRYQHPFTIAYIDLDEFKVVNDRLGHSAGDAVLRTVANAISGALRQSDVVARMGGDEFAILLPETGAAPARLAIQKLRQALSEIVAAHGWRITASIGVATYLTPPDAVDEIVRSADTLMYAAKNGGKNAVEHTTFN